MKYIILGSTGHISKPLSEKLVKAGHEVVVVSSNGKKKHEIESIGAKPAIGSVEDVEFLTKTFTGADAVYTMIPPNMDAVNWKEFISHVGNNYANAIKAVGVKKVVNLSSMGAHLSKDAGLASLYHDMENRLNLLAGIDILHLRPATFYTNFLGNIDMIKNMGIMGNNYGNLLLPMTHPNDIAAVAFEALATLAFEGKNVRYVVSDELSTHDIAKVLGQAIGKPDLAWITFKDEDALNGMLQAGLSQDVAENLMEMGKAVASGASVSDYKKQTTALSATKLKDFAKDFAIAYSNS